MKISALKACKSEGLWWTGTPRRGGRLVLWDPSKGVRGPQVWWQKGGLLGSSHGPPSGTGCLRITTVSVLSKLVNSSHKWTSFQIGIGGFVFNEGTCFQINLRAVLIATWLLRHLWDGWQLGAPLPWAWSRVELGGELEVGWMRWFSRTFTTQMFWDVHCWK